MRAEQREGERVRRLVVAGRARHGHGLRRAASRFVARERVERVRRVVGWRLEPPKVVILDANWPLRLEALGLSGADERRWYRDRQEEAVPTCECCGCAGNLSCGRTELPAEIDQARACALDRAGICQCCRAGLNGPGNDPCAKCGGKGGENDGDGAAGS